MYAPMSVIMEHHFVIASIYKQCMPIALWGQIKLKFKSENFINCHKKLPPGMSYCFQQRWSWSNSCYIYTAHCIVGQLGWKSQNNSRYNTIHDTLPMTTIVHCKTILKKKHITISVLTHCLHLVHVHVCHYFNVNTTTTWEKAKLPECRKEGHNYGSQYSSQSVSVSIKFTPQEVMT